MSKSKDQTKTRVLNWLDEEGRSPTKMDDSLSELNISIALIENEGINVVFRKDKRDSVYITAQISFSPLDTQAFSKLSHDRKKLFTDELNYTLILMNVDYVLFPDSIDLKSVRISKAIYFDALTKDKFFETILLIKRAAKIAKWCISKHLGQKGSTS
jgi:hypothetical protein